MVEQEKVRGRSNRKSRSNTICLIFFVGAIGVIVGCLATWLGLRFSRQSKDSGISKPLNRSLSRPNFIVFLADDVGYGDFRVFGHPNQEWTGVDRMAKEGMIFTHLYSPVSVCSPSRAAILTGRYPRRAGIFGKLQVFGAASSGGLPKREVTIPEALKESGYVTGFTGKWHLGINKENSSDGFHLPKHHGFDVVNTNLPFSQNWFCKQHSSYVPSMSRACFLYNDDKIIEQPINLGSLTSKLVTDTIDFLNQHKDERFFYFMSFPQTHAALFSDPRFAGKSKRGAYGDNVNEMGWAINEVLDHIVKLGIDSETLAIFLSDNGAVRDGCGEEGSNGPFRGGKSTTWEGGIRVPATAWWPGIIKPGGVSHSVLSTLDIFPTILELADQTKSTARPFIDGVSFANEFTRRENTSPAVTEDRPLFFYCSDLLTAVRYRNYKIHYYTNNAFNNATVREKRPICIFDDIPHLDDLIKAFSCRNIFEKEDPPLVFDVEFDSAEHIFINPESQRYQEVIDEMSKLIKLHEGSMEVVESEVDKPALPKLLPCCNPPTCMCNFED